jgi:alkylation response protein AidB-like acyl-CoA dehydrogenase
MPVDLDLDALRTFAEDVVAAEAERQPGLFDSVHAERTSTGSDDRLVPEALEVRRRIRTQAAAKGYYGGFMPREVGGAGWSHATSVEVYETLAAFPPFPQVLWLDLSVFIAGQAWGPTPALLNGTGPFHRGYLDSLMTGQLTSCTAITDPLAGSDPHNMLATARRTETGWLLNGVKKFVGNAPYADVVLFYARTSGELGSQRGISLFLINKDAPGLAITRIHPVMEGRGNHGEITLTDCELPAEALVGEEGAGFRYLMQFIDSGRLLLGALSLGGAQWCLDRTVERLTERSTFGEPLASRQGLRWRLAECQAMIHALRSLVHETARKLDDGASARTETGSAKLLGPRVYSAAADMAIQTYGGEGFMADHGLERHYRRARGMRIYMGTDEMQLNTLAKSLLG